MAARIIHRCAHHRHFQYRNQSGVWGQVRSSVRCFCWFRSTIVTSRDADNVSRMINRAIMSGIMSAGVHCIDLRTTSIPIVRHELRTGKERGGIHVRKSPFDRNSTDIIFFDAQGKDLPSSKTKSIERLFFGEDFSRAHHEQVGTIHFRNARQKVTSSGF